MLLAVAGILTMAFHRDFGNGMRSLGFLAVAWAVGGVAVLIVLGGACWLLWAGAESLVRRWASHHEIDLDGGEEEAN